MSDNSDDDLCAVAAAACTIVIVVESSHVRLKRKRRRTWVRSLIVTPTNWGWCLWLADGWIESDGYGSLLSIHQGVAGWLRLFARGGKISHNWFLSLPYNSVTFSSCAMIGCNCLQQFLLMNILVQAQKYANEPATRCNSFIAASIAAFILLYFTCRPHM